MIKIEGPALDVSVQNGGYSYIEVQPKGLKTIRAERFASGPCCQCTFIDSRGQEHVIILPEKGLEMLRAALNRVEDHL